MWIRSFGVLSVVSVLAACGEPANPTPAEQMGGSGLTGGTVGTSGSNNGGGGSPAAGASSGAGQNTGGAAVGGGNGADDESAGSITIFAPLFSASRRITVAPNFRYVDATASADCDRTNYGACVYSRCRNASSAPARQHAGTITVVSEEANVHIVVTPDANGAYSQQHIVDGSFRGGEALTVSAAGGTIPAFTMQAQFALLLLVSQPMGVAVQGSRTVVVPQPRSQNAELTWTRGAPNVTFHALTTTSIGTGESATLACTFDSMAGSGTISSEALSAMPAGTQLPLYTAWSGRPSDQPTSPGVYVVSDAATPERTASVALRLE